MKKTFFVCILIVTIISLVTPCFAANSSFAPNSGAPYENDIPTVNALGSNTSGNLYFFNDLFSFMDVGFDDISSSIVGYQYNIPRFMGVWSVADEIPQWYQISIQNYYTANFPSDNTNSILNLDVSYSEFGDAYRYSYTPQVPAGTTMAFAGVTGEGNVLDGFAANTTPLSFHYSGECDIFISGTYYLIHNYNGVTTTYKHTVKRATTISSTASSFEPIPYYAGITDPYTSWLFEGLIFVTSLSVPSVTVNYYASGYDVYSSPDNPYASWYGEFTSDFFSNYYANNTSDLAPPLEFYTDFNGEFPIYGTHTGGTIHVNVPTFARDSNYSISENGTYNIGSYNYVTVNVPQEVVSIEESNMFSWLTGAAEAFLQFEIAPDFTIGGILLFVLGFGILIWILKIFLGG